MHFPFSQILSPIKESFLKEEYEYRKGVVDQKDHFSFLCIIFPKGHKFLCYEINDEFGHEIVWKPFDYEDFLVGENWAEKHLEEIVMYESQILISEDRKQATIKKLSDLRAVVVESFIEDGIEVWKVKSPTPLAIISSFQFKLYEDIQYWKEQENI